MPVPKSRKLKKSFIRKHNPKAKSHSSYVSRSQDGAPKQQFVKLKYTERHTFSTAALENQVYTGNGIFDPDVTGIGHQPLGFDQYKAMYNRYKVHGSKCKVTAISQANALGGIGAVCLTAENTNSPSADLHTQMEQSDTKVRWFGTSDGKTVAKTSMYRGTKNIVGLRKDSQLPDKYTALVSANPSDLWYWVITVGTADETTVNASTIVYVTITYYVTFYDKIPLAAS